MRRTRSSRPTAGLAAALALCTGVYGALADDISASDEPFDLSVPLTAPPAQTFLPPSGKTDQSKFIPKPPKPDWTGKAGIDNRVVTPNPALRPEHLPPISTPAQTAGIAWANVTTPGAMLLDRASFETRIDPDHAGRLGMNLSRSLSIGNTLSMTWQHGYAVTHSLPPGTLHVQTPANPKPLAQGSTAIDSEQVLRFKILPAETTLSLGAAISSTDDKWLRSMSAEQKLFSGPVSITGSISETATGTPSKSIKAGIKRTW